MQLDKNEDFVFFFILVDVNLSVIFLCMSRLYFAMIIPNTLLFILGKTLCHKVSISLPFHKATLRNEGQNPPFSPMCCKKRLCRIRDDRRNCSSHSYKCFVEPFKMLIDF